MDFHFVGNLFSMTFTLVVLYSPYIAGVVIPHIVEFLNKDVLKKDEWLRALVTLLTCAFFALLFHWEELLEADDLGSVAQFWAIYFIEAWVVWTFYFKKSNARIFIQDLMALGIRGKIKTMLGPEKISVSTQEEK